MSNRRNLQLERCRWRAGRSDAASLAGGGDAPVAGLLEADRLDPSRACVSVEAFTLRRRGVATTVGFSLVEILVVVGLLSVIILGLVSMFSQTQKAFRLGIAQVDVLESGRAVTDLLNRELSQMAPSRASNTVNFAAGFARLLPAYKPLRQELPGNPAPLRTNLIEELYFLTKENQTWTGIGYYVSGAVGGVGTLYRYEKTNVFSRDLSPLYLGFDQTLIGAIQQGSATNSAINLSVFTNLNRIMDGVVHFKVRGFDTNSVWVNHHIGNPQHGTNIFVQYAPAVPDEPSFATFYSNAVPAFVELELGVLEERAIVRARTITDTLSRSNYLAREAGRVHLFRLRVPVRNVDPTAYQ